ncbi:tetraspanin-36-like [Anomaloglossus baeobatrachus]
MNCLFEEYDGKTTESSAVDIIQQKLLCCGIQNYTSWENTAWFLANHAVPVSCCKKNETDCQGKLDALNKINTEGCEDKLASLILMNLELLMKVVYVFLLTEAIILLCLFINWCRNKRREYETL